MAQVLREIVWPKKGIRPCPACKTGTMVVRKNSKTGELFIGCSRFPQCRWTAGGTYGMDWGGRVHKVPLDPTKLAKRLYGVELDALRTGPPLKPQKYSDYGTYDPEDRSNRDDDSTDIPCVWD